MRLELEPRATSFPLVDSGIAEDAYASVSWDFESLLKKGVAAAQSGERDQARKLLSQATAINPASEDAWMWLASISDYPEELLAFLNRVLDINPDNEKASEWRTQTNSLLAKTFVQRALGARNDGSTDLAKQYLEQALGHDDSCESAWFWKASLADADDSKIEFFEKVLSINPENSDAAAAIERIKYDRVLASLEEARAMVSARDNDKAVEILTELTSNDSPHVQESAWLIMVCTADSEEEKLGFYARVLEVNPGNLKAQDEIAAIMKGRSEQAFVEAKSAAASGDRKKAVEILEGVLAETPESVDAWLLISHLSTSLDDKIEALERVLEIDPSNVAARSGLSFLALTFGSSTAPEEAKAEEPVSVEAVEEDAVTVANEEFEQPTEAVSFADLSVEEVQIAHELSDSVEFAYRQTEETVHVEASVEEPVFEETVFEEPVFEEPVTEEPMMAFEDSTAFAEEVPFEKPEASDFPLPEGSASAFDLSTRPEPARSVEEMFGSVPMHADPASETVDSLSPFVQEALGNDPFASEAPVFAFEEKTEEPAPVFEAPMEPVVEAPQFHAVNACPFCSAENDPQAFECSSCHAAMTLSDIEKLLAGTNAEKEVVQHAVTAMEAEWNSRDFSEAEFISLALGHFNLGNVENGFKYLQEASRLNPNNVILSGHVNTIAIRLDEKRRQSETYQAMPKGKTILVVDDSPTVRKLISGKLEKSGHNVVCAVDGVDALAKLEEGMPDLVLLDITMPRMDGYEVCKQIRSNPAGKNLPVVMISGKDGFFDKVRGRMAGTTGYVTKPFGPETLMKALETYLLPDEVEAN